MNNQSQVELHSKGSRKLHHIGFVLASIDKSAVAFASFLGATWDGNIIFDPLQKVRVTFLKGVSCPGLFARIG